jgi:hypothetical protein
VKASVRHNRTLLVFYFLRMAFQGERVDGARASDAFEVQVQARAVREES